MVHERAYDAVLFDLLTALLDSWTLWNEIAGDPERRRRWRGAYLEISYRAGAYQPYERLVREAASMAGLPVSAADDLMRRYHELRPWPEADEVLATLRRQRVRLAVVTNCSQALGAVAAAQLATPVDLVVTAEEAGFYKPDPHPYRLALERLGVPAQRALFVAGSAYDLVGTSRIPLATYWHDRVGMAMPANAGPPLAHECSLRRVVDVVLGARNTGQ
jgi:2-haloacid dehalogenase